MSIAAPATPTAAAQPRHGLRVLVVWLLLSAIATPLVAIFLGPAIPPGRGSEEASQQVFDNTVMTAIVTPVCVFVVVVIAYALAAFRAREAAVADGPPIRGNPRLEVLWVLVTSTVVLFLAGFGSFELLESGSGGGQGPSPVAVPAGAKLPVQVIGQQWAFTYRYPTYGGLETPHLVLPANTEVELHVTSLDAVHSFWAYDLGVKADANPGVDNVAYVLTKGPLRFDIHCAELCGLWHGYMFDTGQVVPRAQFAAWVRQQQAAFAPVHHYLPPYSTVYLPDPQRRSG